MAEKVVRACADKKENQILLIHIDSESCKVKYEEMRKYFPIYEEAVSHI